MTLSHLVARSLRYYWQTGLLVVLGLMVASGVITGSLVIGDSMRGSLRDSALGRLGSINQALLAPRLFRSSLASSLAQRLSPDLVTSALQTTGAAGNAESEATTPGVAVWGVDSEFWRFYPNASLPALADGQVAVNAALARDLGVTAGAPLLLTVNRPAQLSTDSIFGHRRIEEVADTLRVTVQVVLPDNGSGDFRLDAQSARPRNVFVAREWLADHLGQAGKANVLLASVSPANEATLAQALSQCASLADYGLTIKSKPGHLYVYSDALNLTMAQAKAVRETAQGLGAKATESLIYLATRLRTATTPPRKAVYLVIAGLDTPLPFSGPAAGAAAFPRAGEVWLNDWLATDLQAKVGDRVDLDYLVPSPDGSYPTHTKRLKVAAVVATSGPGADAAFMPDYKGLTDAADMGAWKPPFPVDLSRITPRDDEYWKRYRAAPKAFLDIADVQAMWRAAAPGAPLGEATSVQVAIPPQSPQAAFASTFEAQLTGRLKPQEAGMVFQPVRERALQSSQGTSDFGGLFLGLSMFLVAAGAALAGMLLRVSLDRRAAQMGLMLATGLPERLVRRALLAEGLALTAAGTLLGVPAGVLYAAAIVKALGLWWHGALGSTPALWLHVGPQSLVIGVVSGLLVGWLTSHLGLRGLLGQPVLQLLAGWQALREPPKAPLGRLKLILAAILALALALVVLGLVGAVIGGVIAFFLVGLLLLVAALVGFRLGFGLGRLRELRHSLWSLAWRNAGANPARSLLVIGLLAAATFMIVAVAANTRDLTRLNTRDRNSGSGGFTLAATSTVPLTYDLATPQGRTNLGIGPDDEALLAQCQIISLLESPGEDVSCLNLAKPHAPRLLGVPQALIDRGGFRFTDDGNWQRLTAAASDGTMPAFGDADSVMWTLHSGLGKIYEMSVAGVPLRLKFAGLLPGSIFARELLINEISFRRLYPAVSSPSCFLIETPRGQEQAVAEALRRALGDLGLQVKTTAEVLAEFSQVQNTYLAMFLALGGMGLLLGTVGIVTVIMRSVLERRRELALMSATGFSGPQLARLLLLEHGGLLVAGLAVGTGAALVAVAPQLRQAQAAVNWPALLAMLLAVLFVGLGASVLAVRTALRGSILEALRSE